MLKQYYVGNVTASQVGILPNPYYWWEAGAMWGGLVDYWKYTGDQTYAAEVGQAIVSQASPTVDFMMPNQHFDLGNDDQGFWALTAASALEEGLPVPKGSPKTIWLDLCVNSFNDFVSRWNTTTCNGG
jgi:mannan endo-1,6-alpha-mannosidase